MDLPAILARRHCLTQLAYLGGPGFDLPRFDGLYDAPLSRESLSTLAEIGIKVVGDPGSGNRVIASLQPPHPDLSIDFNGRSDALVVLEHAANLRHGSRISVEGDGHTVLVGRGFGSSKVNLTLRGDHGLLYYGRNCTANFINALVQGNTNIVIGEDCLFSWGIDLRTYDSHALIDVRSKAQINSAKAVVVESHCWIAQDVTVMGGVRIGRGSIVGAGAILTKSVPQRCLVVGIPAKAIRQNVTWARDAFPDRKAIEDAIRASGA